MRTLLIISALLVLSSLSVLQSYAAEENEKFRLNVKADPNILFISGGGEYAEGAIVTLDSAPEKFRDYSFVGWQVDGRWANENPLTIRMDRDHSVLAVYEKTGEIGGIVIDVIPRISEITIDGTIYLPSELPLTFSWTSDSEHTISLPQVVPEGPNTRYNFDSWKDQSKDTERTIIAEEGTEYIALYKVQHYLKPITEQGNVLGGGWHDEGTITEFELESDIVLDKKNENIRYVFNSWSDGDYPNSATNVIAIEPDTSVKANWDIQYNLQLKSNIPDYNLFGTGWYDEGRQVALIAEEELESPNSDTKYVFDRWVSRGPNPVIIPNAHSPSTTITLNEPYVIEAQYKKSFLVNVWTPFGSPIGAGFYDQGEVAEVSLSQTTVEVQPNAVRKIFKSWNTHGARVMDLSADDPDLAKFNSGLGQNLLVFVDSPVNVTADWKTQYFLDLQTTEGKAKGEGWYDLGRLVPVSVEQKSVPAGMWASKTFDRWTGDIEGKEVNQRVMMNGPKVAIAEWKTDNSPGIINGLILAGVAGIAGVVYIKTRKSKLFENDKVKNGLNGTAKSFDKFFALRKQAGTDPNVPEFYEKPKGKKAIMDWLLGRDG